MQFNQGGPIIAVQLENEFGSYDDNEEYKQFLLDVSFAKKVMGVGNKKKTTTWNLHLCFSVINNE